MTEIPKRPNIKGIDISKLTRVRPTKVPTASSFSTLRPLKTNYKRIAIDAGILCLIILIAYGASTIGAFVFNDHYIDNFLGVRLSEESFWSNLIMKGISQPLSQPWIIASFAYDLQNFVFDPSWYHIINLILHFVVCFYFYIFVYTLAKYFWQDDGHNQPVHEISLLSAAILACHPLASEAVAHITGREATLTACNFFLTLNFFLWAFLTKDIRAVLRNYLLTFVFFLQAVFCGVQALAIPAIMLLMAILTKPMGLSFIDWSKHKWGEFIVILFLFSLMPIAGMLGLSAEFSNGVFSPLQATPVYVASQFRSLVVYYLRCFLAPFGLSVLPPFSIANSFLDPFVILGLLILGLAFYAIYRLRKKPMAAIGLAIAVFSYIPPMFFVQNEVVADWRFYIPIAGLALFIASMLKPRLFNWRSDRKIKIGIAVLLAVFVTIDIVRSFDFRSDTTLFKSAIRVNQSDALAQGLLSLALIKDRQNDQGVALAKKAIAINKECQPAYLALGRAYTPNKKVSNAADFYRIAKENLTQAYKLAKDQRLNTMVLFETERDLSLVLLELGEFKEAKTIIDNALMISPNSILLNLAMGKICNKEGEHLKALIHLNKVYARDRLNPDFIEPIIEAELGVANPQLINAAYNTAKMGIVVVPTHKLRLYLAQAALATGHLNESVQYSQAALEERPNEPEALYLRSLVYNASGKYKQSQELKKRALAADPSLPKKMNIVGVNKERKAIVPIEDLYPLAVQ
jgi:tetratricopeptide (TPR) repeat protein